MIGHRAKYRVLGTNDDASSCCCCGREGLKRVVWLQPLTEQGEDDGVPVHFGTMCAAKASGWGYSSRDDAARRIAREEAAAVKHYRELCSAAMKSLVRSGAVAQSRVAFGFDIKLAVWNYGYIYTLPGDSIVNMADPFTQRDEIKAAKARLRAKYQVFDALDRNLTVFEMRTVLSA
jgi:hypothetical protein